MPVRSCKTVCARGCTPPACSIVLASYCWPTPASPDEAIAAQVGLSRATVYNIRRRFAAGGLASSLHEKPRPGKKPKVTARVEAKLCSIVCSDPPRGHSRWTLRLLADRMVELELVDSISHTAVAAALKK